MDIVVNVGGVENVSSLIYCIICLCFYLKDESKVNDDVVWDLKGVIDVVKVGG